MNRLLQLVALALCLGLAARGARALLRPFAPALRRFGARLGPAAPFLAAGLLLFSDLGIDALGSFGLADRVDETMNRAAGMISGPLYGGWRRPGQDAIVIVALDKDFVEEESSGLWPPPYKATQKVVEQILQARPRAIFLDSYYDQPRRGPNNWPDVEGVAALASVFDSAKPLGVPVFVGPISPDHAALAPIAASTSPVGLTPKTNDQSFAYSLKDADGRPMAAVALYGVWASHANRPPLRLTKETLSVDWGFGASAWMKQHMADERSPCVAPTPLARIGKFFELTARAGAPSLSRDLTEADGVVLTCPYFDVVPAGWLKYPQVRDHLKGRIVLVGSTVPWVRDQAPTPLLGEAPGVMLHAMALDNLIENGAAATRYPATLAWSSNLDSSDLVNTALLVLGFLVVRFLHRWLGLAPGESLPFGTKMRVWAMIAVIGVVIACLCNWPLFKLLSAALTGGVSLEAWDRFQEHRQRRQAEGSGK